MLVKGFDYLGVGFEFGNQFVGFGFAYLGYGFGFGLMETGWQ